MHNLEDIIEKYRNELMDFSKQSPVHIANDDSTEGFEKVSAVMAHTDDTSNDGPIREERLLSSLRPYADYEDFVQRNPSTGILKVQITAAVRSFPITNAQVRVTVSLPQGERELYSGYTDIDGSVDNIVLPAPRSDISLDENSTIEPYSVYNIYASHPLFSSAQINNAPIFDSIISVQPIQLVPLTETGNEPGMTLVEEQPMSLFGGEK